MGSRLVPACAAAAVALVVAGSIPASAQVYYYSRGWRDPVYHPVPPAPLPSPHIIIEIPPSEIEAMLRARGFVQISRPSRMGEVYSVHVTDRGSRRVALIVDALSGEIVDREVLGIVIDRRTGLASIENGPPAPDRRDPAVKPPPPTASLAPPGVSSTGPAPGKDPAARAPSVAAKPPAVLQEDAKPSAAPTPAAPSPSAALRPTEAKPTEAKPSDGKPSEGKPANAPAHGAKPQAAADPAANPAAKPTAAKPTAAKSTPAKPARAVNPTAAAKALGKQEERPIWAQRRSPLAAAAPTAPVQPAPPAPNRAPTVAFPPVQGLE